MSKRAQAKTVRRSFALSSKLIDEALMASTEAKGINLNKLVTLALQEYVSNSKRREFEKLTQEMGTDLDILRECAVINKEFTKTEMDGLSRNK